MYQLSVAEDSIMRPTFSPLDGHQAFMSSSFWRIASSIFTMSKLSLLMTVTLVGSTDKQGLSVRYGRIVLMPPFPIRSAAPETAVPPGRLAHDLHADVLLLHTIQTRAAFEELLTTEVLLPDSALADPFLSEAYGWMGRMMAAQLPTSGDAALWLWAKIRRVDLVADCRRARGQVLLTCRIPRERVLLSHFDEWHSVLNSTLAIPKWPGEPEDEFDKRWDQIYDGFHARLKAAGVVNTPISHWPAALVEEAEQSWGCIFDSTNFGTRDYWQATVHRLHAADVIDAVRIID